MGPFGRKGEGDKLGLKVWQNKSRHLESQWRLEAKWVGPGAYKFPYREYTVSYEENHSILKSNFYYILEALYIKRTVFILM